LVLLAIPAERTEEERREEKKRVELAKSLGNRQRLQPGDFC